MYINDFMYGIVGFLIHPENRERAERLLEPFIGPEESDIIPGNVEEDPQLIEKVRKELEEMGETVLLKYFD